MPKVVIWICSLLFLLDIKLHIYLCVFWPEIFHPMGAWTPWISLDLTWPEYFILRAELSLQTLVMLIIVPTHSITETCKEIGVFYVKGKYKNRYFAFFTNSKLWIKHLLELYICLKSAAGMALAAPELWVYQESKQSKVTRSRQSMDILHSKSV